MDESSTPSIKVPRSSDASKKRIQRAGHLPHIAAYERARRQLRIVVDATMQ